MTASHFNAAHSQEVRDRIKELWNTGMPMKQIGQHFTPNLTKGMICGLCSRMGLKRVRPVQRESKPKPVKVEAVPEAEADDPGPQGLVNDFPDRQYDHTCRWPYDRIDGWQLCGGHVDGHGPWCKFHKSKATQPMKKSNVRIFVPDSAAARAFGGRV